MIGPDRDRYAAFTCARGRQSPPRPPRLALNWADWLVLAGALALPVLLFVGITGAAN